jgi:hypothetical protein
MLNPINVKYWELAHTSDSLGSHKSDDYSARCDVCGDSHKKKNSKRLHLYTKSSYEGDFVKCFNGECSQNSSMYNYLKNYHSHLAPSYKQEMGYTKITSLSDTPKMLVIEEVKKVNKLFTFEKPKEFSIPNNKVLEYLQSRGFTKDMIKHQYTKGFKIFLSQGMASLYSTEGKKEVNLKDYIIIPLLEHGKWYGFYSRSLNSKTFHTYLPQENTGYKLWNWFAVNKKEKVYIFEAIFNAMSTSLQGIACLGSDIDEARLKELSKPIFVFDNDDTGRQKSLKYANQGFTVLIYPKDVVNNPKMKDMNDFLKLGWSIEQIDDFITSNLYSGITAVVQLTLQNTKMK